MVYRAGKIRRIARVAFDAARGREKKLTSVDKANVLENGVSGVKSLRKSPANTRRFQLSHLYVDNAAMQLIKNPAIRCGPGREPLRRHPLG